MATDETLPLTTCADLKCNGDFLVKDNAMGGLYVMLVTNSGRDKDSIDPYGAEALIAGGWRRVRYGESDYTQCAVRYGVQQRVKGTNP